MSRLVYATEGDMYVRSIPDAQLRALTRRGQFKDGDKWGQAAARELDRRRIAQKADGGGKKDDDCCGEKECDDRPRDKAGKQEAFIRRFSR